ncbi:MAG: hypothetical protein E7G36_00035 [Peptoniphilus rhinitidis]|uniref:hypothetical protein n=1 Tax=Peptoniphilus rhinitidis TaxID=1175452 RepID=UPI002904F62C|nr:hypothetical protein [Peptoniphilus rhinitidis]MDU2109057.1 hypothetical protein [Peptoniphilus lacydonensis]MDU3750091.1 hypothetical protein [Peptoniphilus rhinitidis]
MNYDKMIRQYNKELKKMGKDLEKYKKICNQYFLDINYDDMLFRMKYDAIARPVPEFQKYIPNELEAKIIDDDLLAVDKRYSGDRSVNDMLKVIQMIRITDFRTKKFLEVGKRMRASNDDPTYESYSAVKFLIYWSAYVPIKRIVDKYNSSDELFKTEFHRNIYNNFIDDTYKARKNFEEVADRLRVIAMRQSRQRMDEIQREKENLINEYNNLRNRF